MTETLDETVTVPRAAKLLQVSQQTIGVWTKKGILIGGRTVRLRVSEVVGSRDRFTLADIAAFKGACHAAKYPGATDEPPVESPTKAKGRGVASKQSLAERLGDR